MATVSFRNVTKQYGTVQVIHGIDLEVADGEFIVIVGPSGCGKSTLLRMVAGLEPITGGEIDIAGRVVNRLEPKDRDIAMVFQNYALYPHMSVFDNMAYGLRIRGLARKDIAERVDRAAGNGDLALGDRLQAGDHAQQRGLAAARGPDDDDELAVGDLGIDAVDHLVRLWPDAVALDDVA